MAGLFQGLEIGRRALLTHQLSLQTVGHNIANVNTPGYSRQRVNVTSTYPESSMQGMLGTGVTVSSVRHIRDLFLGEQFRQENKSLGEWTYKEKVLTQIESLFNEPNDGTLSNLMADFWNSWSDLSTGVQGARSNILSQAKKLTNGFHGLAEQLTKLRDSIDRDLNNYTSEINRLTSEIGNLNRQIKVQEIGLNRANDLRDARDLLLDNLSSIIDVNSLEDSNGEFTVYVGAMSIVNGADSIKINAKVSNVNGQMTHNLVWENTNIVLKNDSGQLKGLMETRDTIIPEYLDKLNTLARTMVTEVNALHATGFGLNDSNGYNFFNVNGTDANSISIDSEIEQDVTKIVASLEAGKKDDNRIALQIADLQNKMVLGNNSQTMDYYYNSLIGSMGVQVKEASSFSRNYELLINQIVFSRESVQGVSLDEEMTNLIKYQHAYDAAARVITAMDQALDTVISGMGIVGR